MKIQLVIAAAVVSLIASGKASAQTCDASATATGYAPGMNKFGMVLFEDMWPQNGDLDFNDQTFAYNFAFNENAAGLVSSLEANIDVLAVGASLDNGLYLHLPVDKSNVDSILLNVGSGAQTQVVPLAAESDVVVQLSANTRALFNATPKTFINTDPALAALPAVALNLIVHFKAPVTLDTGAAPYDLFVERVLEVGHQIHRPMYAGTATMNQALFQSADDASTAAAHFVNHNHLPFVLTIPQVISWPKETAEIDAAYPDITEFATSGGTSNTTWYSTDVVANLTWQGSSQTSQPASVVIGPSLGQPCGVTAPAPVPTTSTSLSAGSTPLGVAFDGANAIWVTNAGTTTVQVFNATTGVATAATCGSYPNGVVFDGTNMWVASIGAVTKINAATYARVGTYMGGSFPSSIAFDQANNAIWVGNGNNAGTVTKLDASSGAILGTYGATGGTVIALASDGTNMWAVTQKSPGTVTKFLASNGSVVGTYPVGNSPMGIAFDGTNMWVTSQTSNNVTELVAATGAVVGTYALPSGGTGIAYDGANMWITNTGNKVTEMVAATGAILGSYPTGANPQGIAFDSVHRHMWIADYGSSMVTKF